MLRMRVYVTRSQLNLGVGGNPIPLDRGRSAGEVLEASLFLALQIPHDRVGRRVGFPGCRRK